MRQYTDQCLVDISTLVEKILNEHYKQTDKWGIQTRTPFEWLTYTMEELGELAEAISEYEYRDGTVGDVVNEAIQGATLLLKIAEMYDKTGG